MSRTQPATFRAKVGDLWWRIRVGPLGIELLTHDAEEYERGGFTFRAGQRRHAVSWEDLVNRLERDHDV